MSTCFANSDIGCAENVKAKHRAMLHSEDGSDLTVEFIWNCIICVGIMTLFENATVCEAFIHRRLFLCCFSGTLFPTSHSILPPGNSSHTPLLGDRLTDSIDCSGLKKALMVQSSGSKCEPWLWPLLFIPSVGDALDSRLKVWRL
jgi:hypothetical protein